MSKPVQCLLTGSTRRPSAFITVVPIKTAGAESCLPAEQCPLGSQPSSAGAGAALQGPGQRSGSAVSGCPLPPLSGNTELNGAGTRRVGRKERRRIKTTWEILADTAAAGATERWRAGAAQPWLDQDEPSSPSLLPCTSASHPPPHPFSPSVWLLFLGLAQPAACLAPGPALAVPGCSPWGCSGSKRSRKLLLSRAGRAVTIRLVPWGLCLLLRQSHQLGNCIATQG